MNNEIKKMVNYCKQIDKLWDNYKLIDRYGLELDFLNDELEDECGLIHKENIKIYEFSKKYYSDEKHKINDEDFKLALWSFDKIATSAIKISEICKKARNLCDEYLNKDKNEKKES